MGSRYAAVAVGLFAALGFALAAAFVSIALRKGCGSIGAYPDAQWDPYPDSIAFSG
jgi:hypothetical protein